MLTCIYNDEIFSHDQNGYSEIEKRHIGRSGGFICPICGSNLYYNSKGKVISHFSHYPGTACDEALLKSHDVDNVRHDYAKDMISIWIKSKLPHSSPIKDKYLPDIGQIADVYFEINELKVAIEIQFKHITPDKMDERHKNYVTSGIKDIWFFVCNNAIDPGSPYERYYYGINNHELYYVNIDTEIVTFYKGMKKDRFDKACIKLMHYISSKCYLSDIDIDNRATLSLPLCRQLYIEKLTDLKEKNIMRIRKNNNFKYEALKRMESRISYKTTKNINTFSDNLSTKKIGNESLLNQVNSDRTNAYNKLIPKQSLKTDLKNINNTTSSKQQKSVKKINILMDTSMDRYNKAYVYSENSKNYIKLVRSYGMIEDVFEITSMTDANNFKLYICRNILNNKLYVLKLYEKDNLCEIKEWC